MRIRSAAAIACMLGTLLSPVRSDAFIFGEFGLKDEMEMGRQFDVLVKSSMPIIEDPEVSRYVQGIVDRIVATLPPQPYKFPASVVLHDSLNAFAAPGGFVFVFSGLIMRLEHESELAGVLAHEIAHVTQRHIAGRIERGKAVSMVSLLGMIAGAAAGAAGGSGAAGAAVIGSAAAGSATMLNYSRIDEDDADRHGMRYLVEAGYDPRGMAGAFQTLDSHDWRGSLGFPTYLSTHPDLNSRLASIKADIQALPEEVRARKNDDGRFRRIQTLLWARYGDARLADQFFSRRGDRDAVSVMGKAMLASRQNRVKDASKLFSQALKLAPRDELILRESAIFEYEKGDMARARRQLEQVLRAAPRDYYARFWYARLLEDSGEHASAQDNFREVLRYVPQDAEVHSHYGRSLGASGKVSGGFLHLAYAAMWSGDDRRARIMLGKAKEAARTAEEKKAIEAFEEKSKARAKIMKEAR